jgi:hypothetical protein
MPPWATILLAMPDGKLSIYDRIVMAINSRGRRESYRQFCARLGLSETYMSALRDRCLKDPNCSIDTANATKIAHDLGMTVDALLGNAPPPTNDPYPGRSEAVDAARKLQFSQRAIDSVYLDNPGADPGPLWWFKRIEAEEVRLSFPPARGAREGAQPPSGGNRGR